MPIDRPLCVHCRGSKGSFWRATYVGAPDGGVPIHVECAEKFFEAIVAENDPWLIWEER